MAVDTPEHATLTQPIDTHAGRTHLVTGPAALTYAEVAEVLGRVLGRSVRYVDLSDEQLKTGLRAGSRSGSPPPWSSSIATPGGGMPQS
jgi:uncharacterized protein YbjT (DUF2867 family)